MKLAAISLVFISLGIQAYILLVLLMELVAMRHTGIASAFGYGTSFTFSVPAYLIAMTLIYGAKIQLPMRWIHCFYFGSHLIILGCMFTFPGQFV